MNTTTTPSPELFAGDNVCCLCGRIGQVDRMGVDNYVFKRSTGEHIGKWCCNGCLIKYDGGVGKGGAGIDAEITRRSQKHPPPASEGMPAFKVGDRVRHKMTGNVATVTRVDSEVNVQYDYGGGGTATAANAPGYWQHEPLAAIQPTPPADEKREFYGTQPSELPETLPAGTTWETFGGRRGEALCEVRLDGQIYRGEFSDTHSKTQSAVHANYIDWTTVRITPAVSDGKNAPARCKRCTVEEYEPGGCVINAEGLCGHCVCDLMNEAKRYTDPLTGEEYNVAAWGVTSNGETDAEAVARRERVEMARLAAEHGRQPLADGDSSGFGNRRGTIDQRIAAARAAARAEGEAATRVEGSTHQRSWPSGAGDEYELAATEGWSGR